MSAKLSSLQLQLHDPKMLVDRVRRFLKEQKENAGASTLVVGLSGGLDSSVTASLCALAVGGRNVFGISMPEEETRNDENIRDAKDVAKRFKIRFRLLDISEPASSIMRTLGQVGKGTVPYGNTKARLRALILYYFANARRGIVVGTSDKSELMLGYFTKYGDGACDIQPLADLYKTSVRELAKYMRLPSRIYSKPPSPELWPGQTALKELGLRYDKLDLILWGLERWMEPERIAEETGLSLGLVNGVRRKWLGSEHKRRPPLALKLGYRTAGHDMRLPYNLS